MIFGVGIDRGAFSDRQIAKGFKVIGWGNGSGSSEMRSTDKEEEARLTDILYIRRCPVQSSCRLRRCVYASHEYCCRLVSRP